MSNPKDLYIITTARKRDTLEWDKECLIFDISRNKELNTNGLSLTIDSWNNISKYVNVKDAFFIFDEQKIVGSGVWVKSFLKIAKKNNWILLSATPGDTWSDFIPVFIANGYYKNRTDFNRQHVIFNRFVSYPLIERYVDVARLENHRRSVVVIMNYENKTRQQHKYITVNYNRTDMDKVKKDRWNIFEDKPIENASELAYTTRKVANLDQSRIDETRSIISNTPKIIIFYNFDYELFLLRDLMIDMGVTWAEWNGHKHQPIPDNDHWVYLVQYTAGAEGWNCIETDTILFYSQNYSYKVMIQAAGRIDRLNTPFDKLTYYHLKSTAPIDIAIMRAIKSKKTFNEKLFYKSYLA